MLDGSVAEEFHDLNGTSNGTSPPIDANVRFAYTVFIVVGSLYVPMIIISNTFVFWGILLYPGFYTCNNFLLMNLAVYDFLMGAFCIPMYILGYTEATKQTINNNKYVCLLKFTSVTLAAGGSIQALLLISIDRYIAVLWPLRYNALITIEKIFKLLTADAVFVCVVSMLPIFGWNNYDYSVQDVNLRCNYYAVLPMPYVVFCTIVCTYTCILGSTFLNIQIIGVVIRQTKKRRPYHTGEHIKQYRSRMMSVKITFALMILFILLWCPYIIIVPFKLRHVSALDIVEANKTFALLIAFSNSSINAAIYAILREEYMEVYGLMVTTPPWRWKVELRQLSREKKYWATCESIPTSITLSPTESLSLDLRTSVEKDTRPPEKVSSDVFSYMGITVPQNTDMNFVFTKEKFRALFGVSENDVDTEI